MASWHFSVNSCSRAAFSQYVVPQGWQGPVFYRGWPSGEIERHISLCLSVHVHHYAVWPFARWTCRLRSADRCVKWINTYITVVGTSCYCCTITCESDPEIEGF